MRSETDLGILPPEQRRSVRYCLRVGQWSVNGPVGAIMAAGYALPVAAVYLGWVPAGPALTTVLGELLVAIALFYAILGPPLMAWIWWSAKISKWRIWALQTVDDWPALEAAAIAGNLIWPRGSIFEKTEWKSDTQRAIEAELLRVRDREG